MKRVPGWFTAIVVVLGLAGLAPGAVAASLPDDPIQTSLVLELHVKLGPTEVLGAAYDGARTVFPIVGGTFSGPGLKGTVVSGGADFFVERPDGTGIVDALYRIRTDDGATIIIHNKGIYTPTPEGLRKEKAGEKLMPADRYCRTVPEFIAPAGRYGWLTRSIFVGTILDGGPDEVIIRIYRVA